MLEQLRTDRLAQIMLISVIIASIFACAMVCWFGFLFVNSSSQQAVPLPNQVSEPMPANLPTATPNPPTVILPEASEPTATSTPVVPATPYDGPTNALSDPAPHLQEISPWGDGGYGMYFEVPVTISRKALLAFGYETAREAMYGDDPPPYVTIHLHFEKHPSCNMGLGIGQSSLSKHLPTTTPADLEGWFAQLVRSHYYGDEPGQSIYLIAYGNDAANKPLCDLSNLK